ncbi:MAG TPA: respiratory nitrate reductase subunit gamma, partial [Oligoflexia bacterium]|nr:respiratory nitrate reductase subunit gamma [Oligoflexia bacterium]
MPPFTISNPLALVEADQPARTILWNISPAGKLTFFSLAAVVLLVFCLTLLWRIRIWLGGHLDGFELRRIGNHLTAFFVDAVALRKTNRDTRACLLHSLIFFGFLSLVFATLVVGIDYHFDISLFRGIFSQLVSLGADLGGAALFAGCALAMSRRLESGQTFRTAKADLVLLLVLAFLVVQGFLVEALRIARLGEPHPLFSPAGALLSLFFWGLSPVSLERLHLFLWWLHALSALGFIVLLPHTKLLHMFAASANIFFAGTRPALPALDSPGDLEEIIADAGSGAVELNSRIG